MKGNIKLAQEWAQKGQSDLRNAKVLLKEGGTIDAVCFHCQQAVEKYLKAFLAFQQLPIRKIHSLVTLAKQGAQKEPALLDFMDDYKTLEAYYIESRYPPDIHVYTKNEGKEAYNLAKEIEVFIKGLLSQSQINSATKGFTVIKLLLVLTAFILTAGGVVVWGKV